MLDRVSAALGAAFCAVALALLALAFAAPAVGRPHSEPDLPGTFLPIQTAMPDPQRTGAAPGGPSAAPTPQPDPTGKPRPTAPPKPTVADAKAYALKRLGQGQYRCLDALWTRESHWGVSDLNAASGAYGIPQALPGSRMASMGGDWRTNPLTQVRWGLGYIHGRYGTPCAALAHSDAAGWY